MSKTRAGTSTFADKGTFLFKKLPMPSYAWQIIEDDLILIEYNDAAYKITNGNIENYIGIKATKLYKDQPEILEDLNKCAREKSNFFKEMKYRFNSVDIEKYLSVNYGFMPPDIVIIHTNDITEKKQAELRNEEMDTKLKDSEKNLKRLNKDLERKIAEKTKEFRKSEEHYRHILENANDIIYILNQNYRLEYINENVFIKQLGYTSEELIGKSPLEYIHPEDIKRVRKGLIKGFKVGQGTIEVRLRDKKGRYHWFEIRGKTFLDSDGKNKVLSIAREINKRKFADQQLKESEEKFRTLTEQSFLGIAILQENLIKYVNKKLADLFDYSIDEIKNWQVGQFLNVIHPEDKEFVAEQAMKKQVGESDAISQYQFRGIKKSGSIIWLEVFSKTINYQEKQADFITILDITEKKLAEEALKTEKKFTEDIINTTSDTIFVFESQTGKAIRWNKAFNDVSGYTDKEISSMKAPNSYYNEDDLVRANEAIKKITEGGEATVELSLITKDGHSIPFEYSARTFKTSDGRDLIVSYGRDITERKDAEKMIASLAKFPSENPNPVLRVNKNKILYINQVGQALFNISEDSRIPSQLQKGVNNAFLYNKSQTFELKLKNRFYVFNITPILETEYANIYGRDITNRKEAEIKLRESEEKYRDAYDRANFYKDLFAHDINNIMQVINSSAELIIYYLNSFQKTEEIGTIAEMIKKQVTRAKLLLNNVNTLSELEEGTKPIKMIEVYELLENSVNYVRTAYQERAIDISIESFSDRIFAHANELLQEVFDNILTNAIKYNDNSLIEILVNVSKVKRGDKKYLKFEFIDNGIGIQDERKEVIFKRGHRDSKGQKGMGLGLSLVKKILAGFNGEIYVENRIKGDYSKGSKFILLVPEA